MQTGTLEEAAALVQSGQRVYLHGGAAVPSLLVEALVARASSLRDVEIVHLHTEGPAPHVAPEMQGHFRHLALFIGRNTRQAVAEGRADYMPVFLSAIPDLFRPDGPLPLDVALLQVARTDVPDRYSLGVSVDCALSAAQHARTVIALVNDQMPATNGHVLPASRIGFAVPVSHPLPEARTGTPDDVCRTIGRLVAGLVPDHATLQMGIGGIPNAVLHELRDRRHLGVHTEMFMDGLLDLVEAGVITGASKTVDRGLIVGSFAIGSERLYRFLDRNPLVAMRPADYTNDVDVIAAQERMVAINSALSVDLTGQVAADSLGTMLYSGIGGQVDFIRGAGRSRGGVPVIALPSTARGGTVSRITVELPPGSGVVTSRGDVHWVVTEYGAVNLFGRPIRERARLLIGIAHPDFRAGLEAEAIRAGLLSRGPRGD